MADPDQLELKFRVDDRELEAGWRRASQGAIRTAQDIQRSWSQTKVGTESLTSAVGKLAAQYISTAAAVDIARRSFLAFADVDVQMRRIGTSAGFGQKEIANLIPEFRRLGAVSGEATRDVIAGFDLFRRRANLSWEEAKRLFPSVIQGSFAAGIGIKTMSEALGTAMLNLKITGPEAKKTMDILFSGVSKANLNLDELSNKMPELTNSMAHWGEVGNGAMANMVGRLSVMQEAYGDTGQAAEALLKIYQSASDPKIAAALGRTPEGLTREMRLMQKQGVNIFDWYIGRISAVTKTGALNIDLLDKSLQRPLRTATAGIDRMRDASDRAARSSGELNKATTALGDSPTVAVNKLLSALEGLALQLGKSLHVGGATDMLGILTRMLGMVNAMIAGMWIIQKALTAPFKFELPSIDELHELGKATAEVLMPEALFKKLEEMEKRHKLDPNKPFGPNAFPSVPGTRAERVTPPEGQSWLDFLQQFGGGGKGGRKQLNLQQPDEDATIPLKASPIAYHPAEIEGRQLEEQRDTNKTLEEILQTLRQIAKGEVAPTALEKEAGAAGGKEGGSYGDWLSGARKGERRERRERRRQPGAPAAPPPDGGDGQAKPDGGDGQAAPPSSPEGTPLPEGYGGLVDPITGKLGGGVGEPRGRRRHAGLDISAPAGSAIYASGSGRIIKHSPRGSYQGDAVTTIRLDDGRIVKYMHHHLDPNLKEGSRVSAGQVIGKSGRANGEDHLHYEMRDKDGNIIDPEKAHQWKRGKGGGTVGGQPSPSGGATVGKPPPATAGPQPTPDTTPTPQFPTEPGASTAPFEQPSQSGKMTWFGSTPGWSDPYQPPGMAGGRETATGTPFETPGVALPGREGLGEMHEVTLPDGRTVWLRKTDVGPGGIVDITSGAAKRIYGSPGNVPSGRAKAKRSELPLPRSRPPEADQPPVAGTPGGPGVPGPPDGIPSYKEGDVIPDQDPEGFGGSKADRLKGAEKGMEKGLEQFQGDPDYWGWRGQRGGTPGHKFDTRTGEPTGQEVNYRPGDTESTHTVKYRMERDPGEHQFRRASLRSQLNREMREADTASYNDPWSA